MFVICLTIPISSSVSPPPPPPYTPPCTTPPWRLQYLLCCLSVYLTPVIILVAHMIPQKTSPLMSKDLYLSPPVHSKYPDHGFKLVNVIPPNGSSILFSNSEQLQYTVIMTISFYCSNHINSSTSSTPLILLFPHLKSIPVFTSFI